MSKTTKAERWLFGVLGILGVLFLFMLFIDMKRAQETTPETRLIQTRVADAYEAQAQAWEAEADYGFVKYDGRNYDKKNNASYAWGDASRVRRNISDAQEIVSNAHLHVLRARENASNWRRTAWWENDGLKELANKAAEAW